MIGPGHPKRFRLEPSKHSAQAQQQDRRRAHIHKTLQASHSWHFASTQSTFTMEMVLANTDQKFQIYEFHFLNSRVL